MNNEVNEKQKCPLHGLKRPVMDELRREEHPPCYFGPLFQILYLKVKKKNLKVK